MRGAPGRAVTSMLSGVLALTAALSFSTTASAHIPARCDPAIDRFAAAQSQVDQALDAYGDWLEARRDRVHRLTPEEAADIVRMVRDRDVAELEANGALVLLFECIG